MARALPNRPLAGDAPAASHHYWSDVDHQRFLAVSAVQPRGLTGDETTLRLQAFGLLRLTPHTSVDTERHRIAWAMKFLDFVWAGQPPEPLQTTCTPENVRLFMTQRMSHLTHSSYVTTQTGIEALARAGAPQQWPTRPPKVTRHLATRPYTLRAQAALYVQVDGLHEPLRSEAHLILDLCFEAAATPFEIGQVLASDVSGTAGRVNLRLVNDDGVIRDAKVFGPAATRLSVRARLLPRDAYLVRPTSRARKKIVWSTCDLIRKRIKDFEFDSNTARHRRICDGLNEIHFRRRCIELGLSSKSHLVHDLLPYMKED